MLYLTIFYYHNSSHEQLIRENPSSLICGIRFIIHAVKSEFIHLRHLLHHRNSAINFEIS